MAPATSGSGVVSVASPASAVLGGACSLRSIFSACCDCYESRLEGISASIFCAGVCGVLGPGLASGVGSEGGRSDAHDADWRRGKSEGNLVLGVGRN
jgi:hypothetical protein